MKLQVKVSYVRGSELPPYDEMSQSWVLFNSDNTQTTELLGNILKNIKSPIKIQGTLDNKDIEGICEYIKTYSVKTSDLLDLDEHDNPDEETIINITAIDDIIGKPQKSLLFSSEERPSQKDWLIYSKLVETYKNSEILVFHIKQLYTPFDHGYFFDTVTILKNECGKIEEYCYQFFLDKEDDELPIRYEKEISEEFPEYEQILYIDDMTNFMSCESTKQKLIKQIYEFEKNPSLESKWKKSISKMNSNLNLNIEGAEWYKSRMKERVLINASLKDNVQENC